MNRQQRRSARRSRHSDGELFDRWLDKKSNCMGFFIEEMPADERVRYLRERGLSDWAIDDIEYNISQSEHQDGVVARVFVAGGEPLGKKVVLGSVTEIDLLHHCACRVMAELSNEIGETASGPFSAVGSDEFKARIREMADREIPDEVMRGLFGR
jgi:hypothetical protein